MSPTPLKQRHAGPPKVNMDWPPVQIENEIDRSFGGINVFSLGILFDQFDRFIRNDISPDKILGVLSQNLNR
jgi:hypothetical protein